MLSVIFHKQKLFYILRHKGTLFPSRDTTIVNLDGLFYNCLEIINMFGFS